MIIENKENLKQLRRDLRQLNIKIKTHSNSLGCFGELFDSNNKPLYFGEIGDIVPQEAFDIIDKFKYNNKGLYII